MSKEYFELFGLLLGIYGFFRAIIWWELNNACQSRHGEKSNFEPRAIDTRYLTQRVKYVQLRDSGKAGTGRVIFTKQLRVDECRQKIAQRAFFQKPSTTVPESLETDRRLLFITL